MPSRTATSSTSSGVPRRRSTRGSGSASASQRTARSSAWRSGPLTSGAHERPPPARPRLAGALVHAHVEQVRAVGEGDAAAVAAQRPRQRDVLGQVPAHALPPAPGGEGAAAHEQALPVDDRPRRRRLASGHVARAGPVGDRRRHRRVQEALGGATAEEARRRPTRGPRPRPGRAPRAPGPAPGAGACRRRGRGPTRPPRPRAPWCSAQALPAQPGRERRAGAAPGRRPAAATSAVASDERSSTTSSSATSGSPRSPSRHGPEARRLVARGDDDRDRAVRRRQPGTGRERRPAPPSAGEAGQDDGRGGRLGAREGSARAHAGRMITD